MFKFCPYCAYKIEKQEKSGFQCSNCKKWTHYGSNPAVSVAVKVGDEGLIAIRAKEPGKGEMDLVGGFLEYGEDPLDCAAREFKEEAGVDIDQNLLKFVGLWVDKYFYQGEDRFVFNVIYLLELKEKFETTPADDVADLTWMPLSQTPKFAFPYLHEVWKKIQQ